MLCNFGHIGRKMVKTLSKKNRYGCSFKDEWAIERAWVTKSDKGPAFCFCKCCQRYFSVSHAGINDVKKHENTDHHKQSIQAGKQSSILTTLCSKRVTTMLSQVKLCSVTSSRNITSPLQWLAIFPNYANKVFLKIV